MDKDNLSYYSFTSVKMMIVIVIPIFTPPASSNEIRWNP